MRTAMSGRARTAAALTVLLLASAAAAWARQENSSDAAQAPAALTSPAVVRLWDTVTPLKAPVSVKQRNGWRAVTAGASAKAKGDLVMETDALLAAFASRLGKVLVFASGDPGRPRAEVIPVELKGKPATLAATIAGQPGGAVTVRADFRVPGAKSLPIAFSFSIDQILRVTPQGNTRGVRLLSPIELAMVPSFVGDDLIYDPRNYPSAKTLAITSEHILLGLLKGERSVLVMTWQAETAPIQLTVNRPSRGKASIAGIDFVSGKSLSLASLDAPGIWHREALNSSLLERDVAISWKPPFPALWLTQLYEDEVKTTYEFRRAKEEVWRGGSVGSYTYPTWFSGETTMLSLGKKIPPQGDAVIYSLERTDETPERMLSPIDIAKATLTGDVLAHLLDVEGRTAWFPERPDRVIGAATCATTDALKAIFDAGEEVEKQETVKGGVEDMYFYLTRMFERNGRYYPFAKDMIAYLNAQERAKPRLAPYLRGLRSIAKEIITTYDNARDTFRDMDYAHELGEKTIALAAEKRPDNPQRMVDLKQDWTGMGGSLEGVARTEHTLARALYQQAGYRAATIPEAAPIAREVRRRARKCLEKPESYEIWANY